MNITLDQIKEYCKENNINIDIPSSKEELPITMQSQTYVDPEAEVYFNYYVENSDKIEKWLKSKIKK